MTGVQTCALPILGQSNAKRILVPINHCDNIVVGVEDLNISRLVTCVTDILKSDRSFILEKDK